MNDKIFFDTNVLVYAFDTVLEWAGDGGRIEKADIPGKGCRP